MNTGNNLLYLLVAMLCGLIIASGLLSEQSLRGLEFVPVVPGEAWAGRPALVGVRVANGKRWRASHCSSGTRISSGSHILCSRCPSLCWASSQRRSGTRSPFGNWHW